MFSTHMPCPLKICCGGGQLLVTGSQSPITRVLGVRIPCPRVPVPESQGPKSQDPRVSGLRVPSLRVPRFWVSGLRVLDHGSGPQVLILDYALSSFKVILIERVHRIFFCFSHSVLCKVS